MIADIIIMSHDLTEVLALIISAIFAAYFASGDE
jgi:hypothetical protein